MLHPDVPTSCNSLLGASWCTILHQGMTSLKEQRPITAFTLRKETQVMSRSHALVSCLHRLVQEFSLLLATISRPNEPTGAIHEPDGPPT
jgi:hypothetical protein